MKVLVVTNMYPVEDMDYYGNFVKTEAKELAKIVDGLDVLFVNGRANKFHYLVGLFRYLLRYRAYDIVHFHHTYVAMYSLMGKPKKMVVTLHEGGNYFCKNSQLEIAYRHGRSRSLEWLLSLLKIRERILERADRIILAFRTKEKIAWRGKEIFCIAPGIDVDRFKGLSRVQARKILNINDETTFLLFPHEPREEKNVHLFQSLVSHLETKGYQVKSQIGGAISFEEMPVYLKACDFFYIFSKFESSPMVAKEGLFCGSQLISFDVGDIRYSFSDNPNCMIVRDLGEAVSETIEMMKRPNGSDDDLSVSLEQATAKYSAAAIRKVYET